MSDNGLQSILESYMRECARQSIKQIFTRFNKAKDNADTERMMRAMKELILTFKFESF